MCVARANVNISMFKSSPATSTFAFAPPQASLGNACASPLISPNVVCVTACANSDFASRSHSLGVANIDHASVVLEHVPVPYVSLGANNSPVHAAMKLLLI